MGKDKKLLEVTIVEGAMKDLEDGNATGGQTSLILSVALFFFMIRIILFPIVIILPKWDSFKNRSEVKKLRLRYKILYFLWISALRLTLVSIILLIVLLLLYFLLH